MNTKGLEKLENIKAKMNTGLSDKLKAEFSEIIDTSLVQRPLVELVLKINPYWLAGFVTGEGCFFVNVFKGTTKTGFAISLVFQITQHSRDENLLKSFISFFNCGRYSTRSSKYHGDFLVTSFSDNYEKIIPFFKKYEIQGTKAKDFSDFCKIANIINTKDHLNTEGLNKILEIKAHMNRNRTI